VSSDRFPFERSRPQSLMPSLSRPQSWYVDPKTGLCHVSRPPSVLSLLSNRELTFDVPMFRLSTLTRKSTSGVAAPSCASATSSSGLASNPTDSNDHTIYSLRIDLSSLPYLLLAPFISLSRVDSLFVYLIHLGFIFPIVSQCISCVEISIYHFSITRLDSKRARRES
jgi:hypothetical protein